ncbi:MarP family serine protease [Luteipulveratus sp. YIM 133132]|uniref:MarP family serine protease n=1 Tax=Luteipulveratus flavus TaxID=3031728 RepID=UPI0023AEF4A5|nr:MarP family serine protease [Luteipulveratus sp. YIM 133132]MDE9366418.1 MarP family serine protease [Luteipulveratus sp. YIM 133132]
MIDLVLLLAATLAAVAGWRRGLVTSALSAGGWLLGLLLGLWAVPALLDLLDQRPTSDLTAALVVTVGALILATVGAGALGALGQRVVGTVSWRPARLLDAGLGATAMVLAALIAGWALISTARPLLSAAAGDQIDRSHGWHLLDRSVPDEARTALGRLNDQLESSPFPKVFHTLPAAPAAPPDASVLGSPAIAQAQESVVKVRSTSDRCGGIAFGSGWVVSDDRVVTNAHVVAGGQRITVRPGGDGSRLDATVVAYDPDLDLAILAVPGLTAQPLPRVPELGTGATGVAAGFPNGGDYHLSPAVVHADAVSSGRNIYDSKTVNRDIYTLSTTVVPGNSGGPLLTRDGGVAGTIFARADNDGSIGFALTDRATDRLLDQAPTLRREVPTGACLSHDG